MGLINRLFGTRPNPRQPRSKAEGVLGYYRTPDGRTNAIKAGGFSTDYINYLQSAPRELRADDAGLITAYFASVFAFRCVETRANKVASIPFNVIDRKTGEALPDTTLARALDWAYVRYQQDIMYLWEFSRTVYGETYLEPVHNLFGQPIGVRWLNPLCIEPYEGANGIEWFDYQSNYGAVHRYKPDEIVFERRFNPANDYRGYGRMSAALDAINIDRSVQAYVKAWFTNGAQPGIVFTAKENTIINPTDAERMRDAVNANVKGVSNWFRPLVMPVALDTTVVSAPPLSEQQVLKEDVRTEICAALGVPIGLVAHDSVRYQLSAEQRNTFYEEEIVPECAALARAATSMLLPFFGDDMRYECKFDVSVLGTQVDMEQRRADSAAAQFAAGGLTYHEYRTALGKGAPEGEDFVMLPADRVAVPLSQIGNAPALISAAQEVLNDAVTIDGGITPGMEQPAPDGVPLVEDVDADKSGTSTLWVGLDCANQPDLVALQQRVKDLYAAAGGNWIPADKYHITLCYAPAISDAQLALARQALEAVEIPTLKLVIGSLKTFDNVGEYALHFRIRRNVALLELQEDIYDALAAAGVGLSTYSNPMQYTPHITLGYMSEKVPAVTFSGRVAIEPAALVVDNGDVNVLRFNLSDDGEPDEEPSDDQAIEELGVWQRYTVKHGASKAADKFTCSHVPEDVQAFVRTELASHTAIDRVAARGIFDAAETRVYAKALQATRSKFELAFEDVLDFARDKTIAKAAFVRKVRSFLRSFGESAYKDGMEDGGLTSDEMDDDDTERLRNLLDDQEQYITSFGAAVYGDDDISDVAAAGKPAMWFNKSIMPFYHAGLASAAENGMFEWVLGDTEHCTTCQALSGQRHRFKAYSKVRLLPQSDTLECGGFNCKCRLVRTKERARGKLPTAAKAHEDAA